MNSEHFSFRDLRVDGLTGPIRILKYGSCLSAFLDLPRGVPAPTTLWNIEGAISESSEHPIVEPGEQVSFQLRCAAPALIAFTWFFGMIAVQPVISPNMTDWVTALNQVAENRRYKLDWVQCGLCGDKGAVGDRGFGLRHGSPRVNKVRCGVGQCSVVIASR